MNRICRRVRKGISHVLCGGMPRDFGPVVEGHLTACPECRRYANELHWTAEGLRGMAQAPRQHPKEFQDRWMLAIRNMRRSSQLEDAAAAVLDFWRAWLVQNRRPLIALSPVWVLILLLKITAPSGVPQEHIVLAASPSEILRVLKSPTLLAGGSEHEFDAPNPKQGAPPRPRSDLAPGQPMGWLRDRSSSMECCLDCRCSVQVPEASRRARLS